MEKVNLLNIKGEVLKDIKLNETIFGIEPNDKVLYDAIILGRAALRQGTHDTKNVDEVRGGGRKPWKQKGTGHARAGSIRSVQWRGGGIYGGPTPRDYSIKMNRKERRLALKSALTYKVKENALIVIEELTLASSKTKDMIALLELLKIADKKVLVVVDELDENIILASRNLKNIALIEATEVNVLDLLTANVVLMTNDALNKIEEVLV
ncbi:MAG: 50S ribosomal protein L4 [Bacilli bacterium]